MRGKCRTCEYCKLFIEPNNKQNRRLICIFNPPQVITILQTIPTALVGQPPQLQSVPIAINPSVDPDFECGRWEKRTTEEESQSSGDSGIAIVGRENG